MIVYGAVKKSLDLNANMHLIEQIATNQGSQFSTPQNSTFFCKC